MGISPREESTVWGEMEMQSGLKLVGEGLDVKVTSE